MHTLEEIERRLAQQAQTKLTSWYHRAVHGSRTKVRKDDGTAGAGDESDDDESAADDFDTSTGFAPDGDFLTDGEYVYQGTKKYPASVLLASLLPSAALLVLGAVAYRDAFQNGAQTAQIALRSANPRARTSRYKAGSRFHRSWCSAMRVASWALRTASIASRPCAAWAGW